MTSTARRIFERLTKFSRASRLPKSTTWEEPARKDVPSRADFFLLYCNGLRQISRLIDIAATAHGDMVCEQLQGDNFQKRQQ